ncbi:MAG: acyltransferase domain-containing protein [Aestuariibacter sp.]
MQNHKLVFMFSGQGSQYYQMGRELLEHNERFRLWMELCDDLLYDEIETSILDVIYGDDADKTIPFDNLLHSNPALVAIEYSLARVLMEQGHTPDYLMGYSLGEVTAMVLAQGIELQDGLRLAVDLAKVAKSGERAAMLAVIADVAVTQQFPDLFKDVFISGYNFPGNFVVTGSEKRVNQLHAALQKRQVVTQLLPVSTAFHTPLLEPLGAEFKHVILKSQSRPLQIPVISCCTGEAMNGFDEDHLWQVLKEPVRFQQTAHNVMQQHNCVFVDVGPSGTLATFIKYLPKTSNEAIPLELLNQFGRDNKTYGKALDTLQHI